MASDFTKNDTGCRRCEILEAVQAEKDKMELELRKARRLETIAALSGGIAHDYNNLLTAIIGNISLALSVLEKNDKVAALLSDAHRAALVAKELTQRLITFSKGGSPLKESVYPAPLIRTATEFTLSGSNVRCEFSLPDNLAPIAVDKTQVAQAIHNIVLNALEAMPHGGTLKVSAVNITHDGLAPDLPPGRYVKIVITDEGAGIPPEDLGKIFDPYFSTKEMGSQKGTGLGLSISYSIIKNHDGDIRVDSRIGQGTAVSIYLPESKDKSHSRDRHAQPSAATDENKPAFGSGRILVMDDEDLVRDIAGKILTHLGYTVAYAENGEEALALYQSALASSEPFDAVILDLTVRAGLGGVETMQKLLTLDPKVVGIVSSGYSSKDVMANYQDYGFKGVIAKPYGIQDMGTKLKKVLS
jgi:nitrogen-specific signal transduction histidine kinase/ActR/RegA family two-component response regulator